MYDYPITIHLEGESCWSTCRDIPEAHSAGDNVDDLLCEAIDGIESALSIYVDQRRPIPAASEPEPGERVVHLPAVTVAKIALWNTMIERGMRKADLCRLLEAKPVAVDRLVDFLHTSKMDQIERALHALGKRLSVSVDAA